MKSPPRLTHLILTTLGLATAAVAQTDWRSPASAAAKANPLSGDSASLAEGRTIYATACVSCHGPSGKGDGPAGLALPQRPGDLSAPALLQQSDGELLWKISEGKTPMPAFKTAYNDNQIWSVINYIRTFADEGGGDGATAGAPSFSSEIPILSDLTVPTAAQFVSFEAGQSQAMLSGFAQARYTNISGEAAAWDGSVSPVVLWKQGDRLLFEGELEIEFEDSADASAALEYAQLSYVANDHLTLGGGVFLNPLSYYNERIHPAWVQKLPDDPLAFGHDGIIAPNRIGFQARGAVPLGKSKFGYAFFLTNGPSQVIGEDESGEEDGHGDAEEEESGGHDEEPLLGSLNFDNLDNFNDNVAVGGRVGLQLTPEFELGYGWELAEVDPASGAFGSVDAVTQAVDANYKRDSDLLQGTLECRAQWVWVDIDNPGIDPLTFSNNSDGGYLQVAYRPTGVGPDWCRDLELVTRYDWLDLPSEQPDAADNQRWTFGLNYWINSRTVLKAAYQTGQRSDHDGSENYSGFVFQAAVGF